jgi:hypothetical protein
MVESVLQVVSAPARVEAAEECFRGRKVASDVDWRRRRREICLPQLDRHVLKVRISVGRAIELCVRELRSILPASRWHGKQGDKDEHEREYPGLPAHRSPSLV